MMLTRFKYTSFVLILFMMSLKSVFAFCEEFAYVVNRLSATVSVIDLATNTVVDTISVGPVPRGIAITPDASFVYVSNPTLDTVNEIDVETNIPTTIPSGTNPYGIAISPDGTTAYIVNNSPGNELSKLDLATNMITATIPLGTNPFNIAITPDGTTAYVTNGLASPSEVDVIDLTTDTYVTSITVENNAFDVLVTIDGTAAYVSNGGSSSVSVIDTATNLVTATITVGPNPRGIATSPNGSLVYVANVTGPSISVIDTATNLVVSTIPLIELPFDLAITPDGDFAYITNTANGVNSVSVLDLNTGIVSPTTIPVGTQPQEIAITPSNVVPLVGSLSVSTKCRKNIFLTETELFTIIEWSAPDGDAVPTQYKVYRNGILIGEVEEGSPRVFVDHNRKKDVKDNYRIVAENGSVIIATGIITSQCDT